MLVTVNEIPYAHLHSDDYIYLTPISLHAIHNLSFKKITLKVLK